MNSESSLPRPQQPANIHYPQDLLFVLLPYFHLCLSIANSHFSLRDFPFTFYEFVISLPRVKLCDRLVGSGFVSLMSHLKTPTITSQLFPHTN